MKDKGTVVSIENNRAEIKVRCLSACHHCSAKVFCIGQSGPDGIISAGNPLNAVPGDTVEVDIPLPRYPRALSLFFGGLLVSSLFGLFLGYFLSHVFALSGPPLSILGLLLGLLTGGLFLFVHFKKENKGRLDPKVSHILIKGGQDG